MAEFARFKLHSNRNIMSNVLGTRHAKALQAATGAMRRTNAAGAPKAVATASAGQRTLLRCLPFVSLCRCQQLHLVNSSRCCASVPHQPSSRRRISCCCAPMGASSAGDVNSETSPSTNPGSAEVPASTHRASDLQLAEAAMTAVESRQFDAAASAGPHKDWDAVVNTVRKKQRNRCRQSCCGGSTDWTFPALLGFCALLLPQVDQHWFIATSITNPE